MEQEYEYYGNVLTNEESADIGEFIVNFEFEDATYQELKQELASRNITLKPYVRDFSCDKNQQEIKERVASETFIPSDLLGYIISSNTYQNILVKIDRHMINVLAEYQKPLAVGTQKKLRVVEKAFALNNDDNSAIGYLDYIDIKFLLAACHIFDDYETFKNNINKFVQKDNKKNKAFNLIQRSNILAWELEELFRKKHNFGLTKVQKFYKDNKEVIDTIAKYLEITKFFEFMGRDSRFRCLYTYIRRNRNQLPRIIENLEKIYKLGIRKLYFDEWLNFSDDEYKIYDNLNCTNPSNRTVICVENVEAKPSYDGYRYKSNNSPYKMILRRYINSEEFYSEDFIMMNDLIIAPDRLPKDLEIYTILTKIMKFPIRKPEISKGIETSVKLGVMIDDLLAELKMQAHEVLKLSEIKSPEELKTILQNIRNQIQRISEFKTSYDQKLITSCDDVTKELLDEEKQAYVKTKKSKNN